MKKILLISLILSSLLSISAQKIIDLEIDEIYIDDDELFLVNKGEINDYNCELESFKIRDFEIFL